MSKESIIKGQIESGFEYELNVETLNDYEILEYFTEVDDGNTLAIPRLINKVLGKEQATELKNHLKSVSEDGKVTMEAMEKAFTEILTTSKSKEVKN